MAFKLLIFFLCLSATLVNSGNFSNFKTVLSGISDNFRTFLKITLISAPNNEFQDFQDNVQNVAKDLVNQAQDFVEKACLLDNDCLRPISKCGGNFLVFFKFRDFSIFCPFFALFQVIFNAIWKPGSFSFWWEEPWLV